MNKLLKNIFELALLNLVLFSILENSTSARLNLPFQPIGNDEKVR